MGWDRSAKPKRMRRKHKKIVFLVALIGSVTVVGIFGVWENFVYGDAKGSIIEFVSGLFSDDEKSAVWDGMSDEGKAILLKHAPDIK